MAAELSTLCYIEQYGKYLMLHRTKKENDVNKDKWIGPGGHFEPDESPEECLVREVFEETGMTLTDYRFRGIVTFVSGSGITEYMHLFTASCPLPEGAPLPECDEGVLEWVSIEDVWDLNIWEGDKIFFRLLDENAPFFSLKLVYDGKDGLVSASLNGDPLELFDIVDQEGNPTGVVKERGVAHRDGSRHTTVHMWIVRPNRKSGWDVLLQRRSYHKESHPGLLDISSAGHIEHGSKPLDAALRELHEELGIEARPEELRYFGTWDIQFDGAFNGFPYHDSELSYEYIYDQPVDIDSLKLQESEVDSVLWIDFQECLDRVRSGELENCLYEGELLLLENALKKQQV
ncbi:MAG: NUDIX domain-containing protein [Lachnospiraceae bacterium]|nr:NUDIX domain-containing protein [Lachnospiraceae bacterium]